MQKTKKVNTDNYLSGEINFNFSVNKEGINIIKIENIPMPKSKKNRYKIGYNKWTRSSFIYKDKEWTQYEQELKFMINNIFMKLDQKNKELFPISCSKIEMVFNFKTRRRKDLINLAQFIDILVELGLLKDDNWENTGTVILEPNYNKNIDYENVSITFYLKNNNINNNEQKSKSTKKENKKESKLSRKKRKNKKKDE